MLLNGGVLDGTRVLDADLVETMCSHQAPTLAYVDRTVRGCGDGPRITDFVGDRLVEHTGTAPGVGRAYAGMVPERGVGVTLAANTADVPIGALGQGVLTLASGETPEEVVPYLGLRRKIRAVAGTYESPRGSTTVTVEPAASDAYIEATSEAGQGWAFPAFPGSRSPDDYRFDAVWSGGLQRSLEFRGTDDGMEFRMGNHRLYRRPT